MQTGKERATERLRERRTDKHTDRQSGMRRSVLSLPWWRRRREGGWGGRRGWRRGERRRGGRGRGREDGRRWRGRRRGAGYVVGCSGRGEVAQGPDKHGRADLRKQVYGAAKVGKIIWVRGLHYDDLLPGVVHQGVEVQFSCVGAAEVAVLSTHGHLDVPRAVHPQADGSAKEIEVRSSWMKVDS